MKSLIYALTGALMSLTLVSAPVVAQELVKVGTFVPEQSVGVSRVIKPWMESVSADVGEDVKLQGFWGGTLGKSPFKQFELVQQFQRVFQRLNVKRRGIVNRLMVHGCR